jgi:hypothetical protein
MDNIPNSTWGGGGGCGVSKSYITLNGDLTANTISTLSTSNIGTINTTSIGLLTNSTIGVINQYINTGNVVSVSSSYNATMYDYYIGVNSNGSGNVTVTMPLGSTLNPGKLYFIKDESGRASIQGYRPIIQMSGGDLIDGNASVVMALNNIALQIMWTGTRWSIV